MIYVFDIDGTICSLTSGQQDYRDAKPFQERIEKNNSLYNIGHTVIYYTARGMGRTNNNVLESYKMFYDFTKNQLNEWGVRYSDLFLGKPSGGLYIDDKGQDARNFYED